MEKYFGKSYRGDPGVPHVPPEDFANIWLGSALFSGLTWVNPYLWQLSSQFNWHDQVMLFEQYHWQQHKKKLAKKNIPYEREPYQFEYNKRPKWLRDTYYFNGPYFFP